MQKTAVIKVLCRSDSLDNTANMLEWAVGHRVEVADETPPSSQICCLLIFTDIEYYENDDAVLDSLGLNIIGKIKGVLSWEVVPREPEKKEPRKLKPQTTAHDAYAYIEEDLVARLLHLPIAISIMRREGEQYAWKILDANGLEDSFEEALGAALLHLTRSYKYIREELIG